MYFNVALHLVKKNKIMATLQLPENGKARYGRTRKSVPSVDLTAMVDLAFLLITFFMLTTSLSKFNAMDVAKPVESPTFAQYPASRTMTILLGKDNKLAWYMGEEKGSETILHTAKYNELNKQLLSNKKEVLAFHKNDLSKFMIVIIKPTAKSSYENLVDALDAMKIAGVSSYTIDDQHFFKTETDYLKQKNLL